MYIFKPTPGYIPTLPTTEAKYHGIELVKDGTMRDVYRSEKPPFEFFGECDGQIFKYDQTEALNAVVASLAQPIPPRPKPGRPPVYEERKPLGRPPIYADRPKRRTINLDEATITAALELGNGNLSAGIRTAVRMVQDSLYDAFKKENKT